MASTTGTITPDATATHHIIPVTTPGKPLANVRFRALAFGGADTRTALQWQAACAAEAIAWADAATVATATSHRALAHMR